MTFNFLIQATRVLDKGNFDEDELRMIYDFTRKLDNDTLIGYFNNCTILSYRNDLELYIEILDTLIDIFEESEEYEKCEILKKKKDQSLDLISVFKMSEEEKKRISEQHKQLEKNAKERKEELKKGLQKPEEKKDNKTS